MPVIDAEEELTEQLQQWNPMQDAYMNTHFNKYTTGPAANLGPGLQTEPQQHVSSDVRVARDIAAATAPKPYLVFKRIPPALTKKGLANICARHGCVKGVRDSNKNDYIFVDFATAADQEATYRALERNIYGFVVNMGKGIQEPKQNYNNLGATGALPISGNQRPDMPCAKNSLDLDSRSYRSSDRHPARPQIRQGPIVSAENYAAKGSLLQRNDPQRHFLIENDAHELERAGLEQMHTALIQNDKCKYRTGRVYKEMPEKMQTFINTKHNKSAGGFDVAQQRFIHAQQHIPQRKMGACAECQRASDFMCYRCATYYCGVDCQTKAWPIHRYVCGKPKNLQISPPPSAASKMSPMSSNSESKSPISSNSDPISPISSSVKSNALLRAPTNPIAEANMPRSGNLVTLTSISKTNVVFIRSKIYEDNMTFFKTISEIQMAAKSLNKLQAPPKCGQIVVGLFNEQYNRALVLNADDLQRIKIIYIDYGNLDAQTMSDLYEAPIHFVTLPRLAIPVILKDVPDCYMTAEIRKFMYSYLNGIDLVLKYNGEEDLIVEKGVYRVELIDDATTKALNKMIAKLCKPLEPTDSQDVYYRDYIKQQMLPAGDQIELVVMDNSLVSTGCISCTTKEYALEIQKFQKDLQIYAESLEQQNYAPRYGLLLALCKAHLKNVDELCIAKYSADQKWYRGRCLDLVGDGHPTIVFFDYGNIAFVSVKDIRRYPSQFTYPIFTSDCEIDGLPEHCNAALVSRLEKLIPNGSIVACTHVKAYEEENFYSITLPNVIENLREEGFLEPLGSSN